MKLVAIAAGIKRNRVSKLGSAAGRSGGRTGPGQVRLAVRPTEPGQGGSKAREEQVRAWRRSGQGLQARAQRRRRGAQRRHDAPISARTASPPGSRASAGARRVASRGVCGRLAPRSTAEPGLLARLDHRAGGDADAAEAEDLGVAVERGSWPRSGAVRSSMAPKPPDHRRAQALVGDRVGERLAQVGEGHAEVLIGPMMPSAGAAARRRREC